MNEPEIPEEAVSELVASGAVCPDCGGVHIGDVEAAILTLSASEESGVKIPWCSCETCGLCRPFREALETLIAASARLDQSPHSEDSL
jgi:hypothetical protein